MKNKNLIKGIAFILMITIISCSPKTHINDSQKMEDEQKEKTGGTVVQAIPPLIIYKTKNDYSDKVPVILSEDKSKITSYPAASDLIRNGELTLPVELHDGFLLDKRGINQNVAFLDISYGTFTKAMRVYTVQQLYDMIIDKDPLTEMYDCGNKTEYKNEEEELNAIIDEGKLDSLKKLK